MPAPANVNVADSENPGDVIITWDAVPSAAYYRIGWVAYPDYVEISEEGGRPWSEAFAFVDVENIGQTSRTIRRLTPGALYAFRVASNVSLYGEPSWSGWVLLDLAAAPAVDYRSQYPDCDAVREHHPGGVRQGSPIYRSDLDRDGDGLACEATSTVPSGNYLPIQDIGTFTGTGDNADNVIRLDAGVYRVTSSRTNTDGNFFVELVELSTGNSGYVGIYGRDDAGGSELETIYDDDSSFRLQAGNYVLQVDTDNDWTVRIDLLQAH